MITLEEYQKSLKSAEIAFVNSPPLTISLLRKTIGSTEWLNTQLSEEQARTIQREIIPEWTEFAFINLEE